MKSIHRKFMEKYSKEMYGKVFIGNTWKSIRRKFVEKYSKEIHRKVFEGNVYRKVFKGNMKKTPCC